MAQQAMLQVSDKVLTLTDYWSGRSFSSLTALGFQSGLLQAAIGAGTAQAVRGVSLSQPNLLQLLDSDPSTGNAPFFSLPLSSIPTFNQPVYAILELGAEASALRTPVSGSVAVRVETGPDNVTRIAVDGDSRKVKDFVQIDLSDGLVLGASRVDAAGRPWLDLQFLSLLANVTAGAQTLRTLFTLSEGEAGFYIRFKDFPLQFGSESVQELRASIILDSTPNFAPYLVGAAPGAAKTFAVQAGRPAALGKTLFYGDDFQAGAGVASGLDLVDPASASPAASTLIADWLQAVPRPVLVAEPTTGTLVIDGQGSVVFPALASVTTEVNPVAISGSASPQATEPFVRFADQVYRALTGDELSRLQFSVRGQEAFAHPATNLSFIVRDAQGGMSGDTVAKLSLTSAMVEGTVIDWKTQQPLPGVTVRLTPEVKLSDSASIEKVSAVNGSWSLPGLDFDRFVASASLSANQSQANSVSATDVLHALKLAAGRDPASVQATHPAEASYRLLAADFDSNGSVDESDAAHILRAALGEQGALLPRWQFVPIPEVAAPGQQAELSSSPSASVAGGYAFEAQIQTRIDWVGILVGDVDGSWSTTSSGGAAPMAINPLDPLYGG